MVSHIVALDDRRVQLHLAALEISPVGFDKHFTGPQILVRGVGNYTVSVS